MTAKPPGPVLPRRAAATVQVAEARRAREAAALRANLQRRKQQARSRDDSPSAPPKPS